jgi:DNA (cytosine-5)-methyltransferase 1
MNPITFGSLFAGIGGIDLGFERCGMECKWQVEINDYAQKVLAKHWPKVHRERDIRECSARNLERVGIIAGGFPCQDISYAGLGAGLDGERSGLFFEAIRLVRELQPRAVVLENVAALLTRGLDRVLGTLAEIGYDAEWHCIPAAYVGAPHIRDRVFVLAYANSQHGRASRASKAQARATVAIDAASKQSRPMADTQGNRWQQGWQDGRGSKERTRKGQECRSGGGGEASSYANSERLEKRQGQDAIGAGQDGRPELGRSEWWAVEPDVGRVAHGVSARVDRLRGLGNAVVPQVAELVGKMVIKRLNQF